ncbi:hypothetical protein B9Y01_04755 [Acinetobacter baumannii]|uniref:Uncharacterized protein n=2 Tax=Acinetobacter baumannii TaxID=470 RepID=N9JSA4_ACIBA|nr:MULTISPECIES: hypothetical protein [Acinetobacter calcoaceticus/baumannii complex]ENW74573.1 hypothetical protein F913_01032 [Acinetobacter baumannii NIPH 80]EXE79482.1 hypothetical protein J582_0366 [Acinetobacter sp. 1566109]KMV03813.1 hypothetical protein AB994_2573 [Acinetobacter baumannii]MBD0491589.1 hypothetical protein [Acinetobacter baumannii]MBJ9959295.1 hypothetical protein [Acinetobacter nosocomialis]
MSTDEATIKLTEIIKQQTDELNQKIEKNAEIQNGLLENIQKTIDYFYELKDGNHISEEAMTKYPLHLDNCKRGINNCIILAERLKSYVSSVNEHHEDLSYMESLNLTLTSMIKEYDAYNFYKLPNEIGSAEASLIIGENFITNYTTEKKKFNQIIVKEIKEMLDEAEKELRDFKILKNILKNLKTEDYYSNESKKYKIAHYIYLGLFLVTLIGALCISAYSICAEPIYFLDNFDYWFLKISFILVVITLVSFFIKQSSHYQSLADQANQTRLEIQAFPTFVTGIEKADEVAIRKELALKYFGREVDKTAHKDMGNLVSDQMKSTTEMVKATTEAIKNLKG